MTEQETIDELITTLKALVDAVTPFERKLNATFADTGGASMPAMEKARAVIARLSAE